MAAGETGGRIECKLEIKAGISIQRLKGGRRVLGRLVERNRVHVGRLKMITGGA